MPNLVGDSNNPNVAAVFGNNTNGGTGVSGSSISGWGTSGRSETNTGVTGLSTSGTGVSGGSQSGVGVSAYSHSNTALYAEAAGHHTTPVLMLRHRGYGSLIRGLNPDGGWVFGVDSYGDISAKNDVYARGVRLTSDKNAKENFSNVNTLEILDNLASMPSSLGAIKTIHLMSVTLARLLRISIPPSD